MQLRSSSLAVFLNEKTLRNLADKSNELYMIEDSNKLLISQDKEYVEKNIRT